MYKNTRNSPINYTLKHKNSIFPRKTWIFTQHKSKNVSKFYFLDVPLNLNLIFRGKISHFLVHHFSHFSFNSHFLFLVLVFIVFSILTHSYYFHLTHSYYFHAKSKLLFSFNSKLLFSF